MNGIQEVGGSIPLFSTISTMLLRILMQFITAKEAANKIQPNSTILAGGFLACGAATECFEEICKSGVKDLTLVCNDTAYADVSYGKLIAAKQVKKLIASHIGTNKATLEQMRAGELEVELSPQGSLAERIRAGGYGLGGVLVKTGLGTLAQRGKQVVKVGEEEFLLELPIRGDVALIYATRCDAYGNLAFEGTTRNFNPVMAMAADVVIAEVEEFSSEAIEPNLVAIPSVVVDFVVIRGGLANLSKPNLNQRA